MRVLNPCLLILLGALLVHGTQAHAQESRKTDEHLQKGDYLFKSGYFLKASEHYRLALLDDPSNPWKKLAFGHALFAIGNYSYASYALRRGISELNPLEPFRPEVVSLFPSRRAFTRAKRDLIRYVTYSPRDPAGLTVLGYVLFSIDGEEKRCRDMFRYLKRLDKKDAFADFFLEQLKRRTQQPPLAKARPAGKKPKGIPEAEARKPTKDTALKKVIPPPKRQKEKTKREWPKPVAAPAK